MAQLHIYPPDLRRPRDDDGVGDCGRKAHQRGDVDGSARPLWFHAVFGGGEIALRSRVEGGRGH